MTSISKEAAPGSSRSKPVWEEKVLVVSQRDWERGPANEVTEEPLAQITWPVAGMEAALRAHQETISIAHSAAVPAPSARAHRWHLPRVWVGGSKGVFALEEAGCAQGCVNLVGHVFWQVN